MVVRELTNTEALRSLSSLRDLANSMGPDLWRASSDTAHVCACYLVAHPRVLEVRYPGLKQDPLFTEASHTLMRGFGPYVVFRTSENAFELDCTHEANPQSLICELEHSLS